MWSHPALSYCWVNTHSVAKSSMSVSQSGKKGQVEEPLKSQHELRERESQRARETESEREPAFVSCQPDKKKAKEVLMSCWWWWGNGGVDYFLISRRQKVVLAPVCVLHTCRRIKIHTFSEEYRSTVSTNSMHLITVVLSIEFWLWHLRSIIQMSDNCM